MPGARPPRARAARLRAGARGHATAADRRRRLRSHRRTLGGGARCTRVQGRAPSDLVVALAIDRQASRPPALRLLRSVRAHRARAPLRRAVRVAGPGGVRRRAQPAARRQPNPRPGSGQPARDHGARAAPGHDRASPATAPEGSHCPKAWTTASCLRPCCRRCSSGSAGCRRTRANCARSCASAAGDAPDGRRLSEADRRARREPGVQGARRAGRGAGARRRRRALSLQPARLPRSRCGDARARARARCCPARAGRAVARRNRRRRATARPPSARERQWA